MSTAVDIAEIIGGIFMLAIMAELWGDAVSNMIHSLNTKTIVTHKVCPRCGDEEKDT